MRKSKSAPVTGRNKATPVVSGAPQTVFTKSNANRGFPVVGIGASAGGLEAIESFLGKVPAGTHVAFVIITHLDPSHPGLMPELLQRMTALPVQQVKDYAVIKPGTVYVIPPNCNMSLLKGRFHLFEPIEKRGLRLPIDFFFRSMAEDLKERSVGLILSGMGSDGTIGLQSIREKSGLCLVQDPLSAQFNSMPRSAIDLGLADIIAPPDEMYPKLISYLSKVQFLPKTAPIESKVLSGLEKIVILLRNHTGHDFSSYKKNTVYRRIERRMLVHQIEKISTYVQFLQVNPKESDILFRELLIGVTEFFRDTQVWEVLRDRILPGWFLHYPKGKQFRVWIPACSTGEEAYTFAIIFCEALERCKVRNQFTLQIFATDLDPDAIEKARKGLFPVNISGTVTPERIRRYFVNEEGSFRISAEIRGMIMFATQNVISDPPFTKLDLISCRNLLIYLESEIQKKMLPLFHYSLNPDGTLVLGTAETIGNFNNLFEPIEAKLRIFSRGKSFVTPAMIDFPIVVSNAKKDNEITIKRIKMDDTFQNQVEKLILQNFAPAAILIRDKGDILYISGRTGNYLEPAAGKANWNIFVMAREGLRNELPVAIAKVLREKSSITLQNIRIPNINVQIAVDVTIQYLDNPESIQGTILIIIKDVPIPISLQKSTTTGRKTMINHRVTELQLELKNAMEELATTREEMLTSQEELKSTNEELQSTNEELQSTNEELTTSKEEMQSLNEEMQTVNSELQSKVEELSKTSDDMRNLLDSTEIATVFLDRDLRIRRFTQQATTLFKLIPGDVGRPLTDLTNVMAYPELENDASGVLRTLVFREKSIQTSDGRWLNVRIMPYRTITDQIDGLVITFSDITHSKNLEIGLNETITKLSASKLLHDEKEPA